MPALLNAGSARVWHSPQWPTVCRPWYSTTCNMSGVGMRSGRLTANRKQPMLFAVGLSALCQSGWKRFRSIQARSQPPGPPPLDAEIQQLIDANQTSANNPEAAEGGIKTVAQDAATSCYAATAAELPVRRSLFQRTANRSSCSRRSNFQWWCTHYAIDPSHADQLWSISEELIGQ